LPFYNNKAEYNRETLLRWTNKTDDETDCRPDVTITRIKQMSFDHNLGHGEVKKCGGNAHDLALDLLRISILAKNTLDFYKLDSSFVVQVNGFSVTFYFISLEIKSCLYYVGSKESQGSFHCTVFSTRNVA
jgi:hypothetical protein